MSTFITIVTLSLLRNHIGHLMISYERNYVTRVRSSRSQNREPISSGMTAFT